MPKTPKSSLPAQKKTVRTASPQGEDATKTVPRTKKSVSAPQSSNRRKPKLWGDGCEYRKVRRSSLKFAEYNPRIMDAHAARGLSQSIRDSGGLVETPTWNSQTGNLIGGHQRIAQLDKLNGYDPDNPPEPGSELDYEITVGVLDISLDEEIELNIRLNNPNIQGVYDVDILLSLLETPEAEIRLDRTGFDATSLEDLCLSAGVDLPQWLSGETDEEIEAVDTILDEAAELIGEADDAKAEAKTAKHSEEEIQDFKRKKERFRQEQAFKHQLNTYVRLVAATDATLVAFLHRLGLPESTTHLDLIRMLQTLGHDPDDILSDSSPLTDAYAAQTGDDSTDETSASDVDDSEATDSPDDVHSPENAGRKGKQSRKSSRRLKETRRAKTV